MATSITQITAPRVDFLDPRTGKISREWYMFLYNLYTITGAGTGVTAVINGGTGLSTIPSNGQLLIGNGTGYTLNTLGFGAGISVTNGSGTITVANTGVLSNIAGTGISVSGATGNVTITNAGVLSFTGGTTGLTPASATTGAVTLAGTLAAKNGGTGFASYAVGDLLYANTTTTLAKLPDVATGNALISGGVSTAPSWGKIGLTTHVSGVLPIANGGTNGTATPTTYGVSYGTGSAYAFTAAGTTGQILTATTGGAPTWAAPATSGDVVGPASATDNAIARFDGTTGKLIQNSVVTISDTGATTGVTTLAASTSVTTPIVQASNSAGLSLKNASGTTQMSVGAGGGDNMSINVSTNLNGTNAQIDISPTGTGHVHIKPSGTGSVEVAPTNVGTIDNMTIGATTPKNASVVDLSVTGTLSFDAAQGTVGQVLTSAGTGVTPTWTTPTTGTVTAVSVVSANGLAGTSSGGATPALTLSTSITGILKGNGTAISAATSGTDYAPATSGTSILYGNGSGGFSNVTVGTGLSFAAGTLASTVAAPSAPVTQTANFTVAATDVWSINNKSGSTCTVTLPTPSTNSGRVLYFQNYQVQTLVSASSNVVPLAGGAAGTSILLASSGDSATLVSDGTNWLMTQYISNNNLLLE
jgi:hypothetical protein